MEGQIEDAPAILERMTDIRPSIAIVGPTACGKTRRAVEVAQAFNGEIISADSRQIYRRMDIGTGKDLEEYGDIPYHLIDICEPGIQYNLHQYLQQFRNKYEEIETRNHRAVICGGSGMYVENAIGGIRLPEVPENPELRDSLRTKSLEELTEILRNYRALHNVTDSDTKARAIRAIEIEEYYRRHPEEASESTYQGATPLECVIVGVDIDRESRRQRISKRLDARLKEGMVEEVKSLLDEGIPAENLIYYGLEYKFVTRYLIGELTYEEMRRGLEIAIHQFAKRQMTWFRGMERRGFKINWVPYDLTTPQFIDTVSKLIL